MTKYRVSLSDDDTAGAPHASALAPVVSLFEIDAPTPERAVEGAISLWQRDTGTSSQPKSLAITRIGADGGTPAVINELWAAHRSGDEQRLRAAVRAAHAEGMDRDQVAGELMTTPSESGNS